MALKIKGLLFSRPPIVIIGDYLLQIRWATASNNPHLWWRSGNLRSSLIEVGIENPFGEVSSITLVLADMLASPSQLESLWSLESTIVHSCSLIAEPGQTSSPPAYVDDPSGLSIALQEQRFSIALSEYPQPQLCVEAGYVRLYLRSDNCLEAIVIDELPEDDCTHLRAIFTCLNQQ